MNKGQMYVAIVLTTVGSVLVSLGTYSKIWESKQPEQNIPQAKVVSIEPYGSTNDLHLSSRGYRVYIAGEDRPIYIPAKKWDDTVQEGDTVDVVVSRSFPWFGLIDRLD